MSGLFADPEPKTVCVACSHNGQRRQCSASALIGSSAGDTFFADFGSGCAFDFDFDFDFICAPRSRRVQ
jgi:hypothetical protein